jgi:hypothetical protein
MSMTLEAEQEKDMTQQVRQTETSATTKATASPTISSSVLLPPALAYAHGRLKAMYGETRESLIPVPQPAKYNQMKEFATKRQFALLMAGLLALLLLLYVQIVW